MEMNKAKEEIMSYLMIVVGVTLLAVGINVFYSPYNLVTGGVSGLAIIIKSATSGVMDGGIPLWVTNLAINIPLFLIAIKIKGKEFAGKSVFASLFLSVALWYTEFIPAIQCDLLITSIFGGIFAGAGIGLALKASATTGGTDLLAVIMQKFMPRFTVASIMRVIDSIIVVVGLFIFGIEKGMYALISIFVVTKVINTIVEGVNYSKFVYIISDHSDEIARELMNGLNRGVTGINGEGMYTKENKKILFVVCPSNEIAKLQHAVLSVDDKAFITISDAREVMGRGFTEPKYDL